MSVTAPARTERSVAGNPPAVLCIVSHSSAGGAQEIWANLAEGLATRGYPVKLVALYPYRENVRATPDFLPWTYIVPQRPTTPLAQVAMFRALVAFLRKEKAAVAFTALPAANTMVALAAQLAGSGTRVVPSHHSPVDQYNKLLNRLDSLVGTLPSVSAIVSVSGAVEASLDAKPAGYRGKSRVIHNALPPAIEKLTSELAGGRVRVAAAGRVVVATGRLAAQKNYPALIRAAQHLPDVTIRIVGDGPDAGALKGLAKTLGVDGRVEFLGFRPRHETMAILAAGDVFAQPSLYEGHSLALIEAARLGLPIVVSDVPSQLEGITLGTERCGVVVGPEDDAGLARAILGLLDDADTYRRFADLSRRLGAAATFDAMLDAYELLAR